MKYLKQFVIGSSLLIFAPFFYGYDILKKPGYSYFKYSLIAPLWFGVWNVISLYLANSFNLSMRVRFLLISCISYLTVITYNTYNNVYDFNNKRWVIYYIGMFLTYMFVWNVMIYQIEKRIS